MIECPICNAANEDRSLFCSECGQRLGAKSQNAINGSGQSSGEGLLQTPRLDAVPSHPSFKLHSPILDLGAGEKSPINQESLPHNPGSISRNGLHSPLLDVRDKKSPFPKNENFTNGNSKSVPPADLISQLSADPAVRSSSDSGQQGKLRRSNQGLRSPLLSGGEDYQPGESSHMAAADTSGISGKLSGGDQSIRLHSPVLDGPAEASRQFAPDTQDLEQSAEEYDSLRSPILAAKVRLPDKSQLPQNPDLAGLPLNKGNDQFASQTMNKSLSGFPDDKDFAEFKSDAQSANASASTNTAGQQTIQSILNTSTSTKNTSPATSAFTPLLFDQSQTVTGDKPVISPANKPIYFSGISDAKANSFSSSRTMPAINPSSMSSVEKALPEETELKRNHPFYRAIVIIMIVAAIVFKFCYLQALGNTIFSSIPFLLDQAGQVLVILLLLFLALTAKF